MGRSQAAKLGTRVRERWEWSGTWSAAAYRACDDMVVSRIQQLAPPESTAKHRRPLLSNTHNCNLCYLLISPRGRSQQPLHYCQFRGMSSQSSRRLQCCRRRGAPTVKFFPRSTALPFDCSLARHFLTDLLVNRRPRIWACTPAKLAFGRKGFSATTASASIQDQIASARPSSDINNSKPPPSVGQLNGNP